MKKNKLYTITKGNLFALGDQIQTTGLSVSGTPTFADHGYDKAPNIPKIDLSKYYKPKNSFFSNQAVQQGLGFAANMADQIPTGDKRGLYDTLDPLYHLAGGKESAVGNGLSDVGVGLFKTGASSGNGALMLAGAIAKSAGGVYNTLFGIGTDDNKLKSAQAGIDYYKNFRSNAHTYDDVEDLVSMGSFQNPYSGGLFKKGKAESMNKELASTWNWNKDWAERDKANNIYNIGQDMQNEFWRNYSAFGGPIDGALGIMQDDKYIDAINNRSNAISKAGTFAQQTPTFGNAVNRFADGGGIHIKPSHKGLFTEKANRAGMGVQEYASHVLANKENYPASTVKQANFAKNAAGWKHDDGGFVNSFLQDPVQAAMQYIQQQDALEAQQAAQQEAMAQQQAYDDLVTRLQATETQNQGLQALLNSQASDIRTLQELQAANHIDNEAANYANEVIDKAVSKGGSKNWNYIEDKLRKSGKFNDVQIAGIKLNLQRESGFNPTAVGDGGKAYGLAQWHPDRQPKDRSMDGQINHLINTLSAFDGSKHWVGRSNYEGFLNARTPEEAHYYIAKGFERPAASITDKLRNASNMSLRRLRAFGGELGTNGTDFTNGLLEINAGSSHEDNPYQGVQLGVDSQGVPNLVEEGETVFNDYVYSNRMNVPSFMKKELGLGGNKNQDITFAEASKKLAEASVERPNNPIDQAGLEASLSKLAQVQEAERMKMQAEQQNTEMEMMNGMPMEEGLVAACGGKLYAGGGAMDYLQRKTKGEVLGNKRQIAAAMDAYINKYMKGSKASNSTKYSQAYDAVMKGMGNFRTPTQFRSEEASRKHYNELVNLGMDKRVAFGLSFPKATKTIDPYSPKGYNVQQYNQATSRRDALYNELVMGNKASTASSTSPSGATTWGNTQSGVHTRTMNGRTQYRGANGRYYNSEQQALNTRTNRASAAPTVESAAQNITQPAAARATRRASAPVVNQRAAVNTPTPVSQGNDSGFLAPAAYMNNATWNLENYDWLTNPEYQDSLTEGHIPFSRSASPEAITRAENSDTFRNWTDYVLKNWENDDVQGYLKELDRVAGGNHLFNPDGTPVSAEDAQAYFQRARGMGDNADHAWGYYHLTPSQIANNPAATTPAAPQNKVYHAVEGDDDYLPDDRNKWVGVGDEVRTVTLDNGDKVIYHNRGNNQPNTFTEEQLNEGVNNVGRNPGNGNPRPYDTWMRYAPAVGAGIMTLTDALGLTNKSDYTYPDKLEAAAQQAGYAPRVHPWFIGDYMRPKVFDTLYYANQLQANSRATDRALDNNAAPIGTRMAGMLANNYNAQLGLGDLYRKGEEFNQAQEEKRKEFNRKTNMFNAQMGMDAELANARQRQQAASSYMSGLAQAAAMRDSIDSRIGAARSANITNLLNNLGMIGRENFAFNQINSDRSRRHALGRNGWSWDKIADAWAQGNQGAFGGEVEKYYNKKRQGRRK